MQKWEYLFVTTDNRRASDGGLQELLLVNGKIEEVPCIPLRWQIAEQFGEQGWELVSENHEEQYWAMTFKRPKS